MQLFTDKKFKSATNTAVLYHDERFDILLKIIDTPEFMFGGKKTSLICVT